MVCTCNSFIYQACDFPVCLVYYFLQDFTQSKHSIKFSLVQNMEVICKYLKQDHLFLEFPFLYSFKSESLVHLIEKKIQMTTLTLFLQVRWKGVKDEEGKKW